jgi:DNA-binding response OmpR family regulator
MKNSKPTILALSGSPETRAFYRKHLESDDTNLLIRQSRERGIHLLEISEISLLIIDHELEDGPGLELIQEIRQGDAYFNSVPIYGFGRSNFRENDCIALFTEGADDYSSSLPNPEIFKARVAKLLRWHIQQTNNPVKLATKLDSKEVPGILQLLEAEKSTGILTASHLKEKASATLQDGYIISANSEYCNGKDAITEILAWPFVQIKFIEDKQVPAAVKEPISINISSALMDCVLEVDIYHDATKRLNDPEMSFQSGTQHLPTNSNRVAKQVITLANTGLSLQEICETVRVNRRHLFLMIDQMVSADFLKVSPAPFENYINDSHKLLTSLNPLTASIASNCKNQMKELELPLARTLSETKFISSAHPVEPGPAIIIAGDNTENTNEIFKTISTIAANTSAMHDKIQSDRKGDLRTRLIFDNHMSLDLILCANKLDFHYLEKIQRDYPETAAVIYSISTLDAPSNHANRRNLRKLRERFHTPFTVALTVPQPEEGEPQFVFECHNCTHKLSAEMDMEGATCSCPICNTEIVTPNCLSYAQQHLNLNPLVPVVTLAADSHELWRDLVDMVLDDIKGVYKYRLSPR